MADSISTLALRVDSQTALNHLNEFGLAAANLGNVTDVLKGKLLQLNAKFLSLNFAKNLVSEAAFGQEALGKYEQVLGRYTKQADKLVNELRQSFNFDTANARQSISTMVDLFTKAGIGMQDALDYTKDLQKRAADLEAFTNAEGGLVQVTNALTGGMLGNMVPLKKLGIVMNDEALKAQLAEDKTNGLRFATERAAKAHARYAIIMKQSQSSEGQVARESDNFSNKLRKLRGVVNDLKGEFGDALIPVATKVVDATTKVAKALEATSPATKRLIVGVGAATGALITFGPTIAKAMLAVKALTTAGVANAAASETIVTTKNAEAAARARNAAAIGAENAALNSQTRANLGSSASSVRFGSPLSKAEKRAAKIAWRQQTEGARKFALLPGGEVLGATGKQLGKTGAKGAIGRTVGTLGTAAATSGKTLGGTFGKLLAPLGKFNSFLGKTFSTIAGKLPLIARFGGLVGKFLGVLGTGGAIIGAVIGALQVFKNLPQWIETIYEEAWPRIMEFGKKIPDLLWKGIKSAGGAIGKAGTWLKDLTVGAMVGIGQTAARLAGYETAASKQYKINKLLEERNAQHEKLLAIQAKQVEQEKELYSAETEARNKDLSTRAKYALGRNDEQTKLQVALDDLAETEQKQKSYRDRLDQMNGSGYTDSETGERIRGVAEIKAAQAANEERQKKFNAEMDQKYLAASDSVARLTIKREREAGNEKFASQFAEFESEMARTVELANAMKEELGGLNETWLEQKQAVDELQKAVDDSATAFKDDQKTFARSGEEVAKSLASEAIQARIESAKTRSERLEALAAQREAAEKEVEQAEQAGKRREAANAEIGAINGRLQSEDAWKGLAALSAIANRGDVESLSESERAELGLKYSGALASLEKAGYQIDDRFVGLRNGNATALLEDINGKRIEEKKRLGELAQEREEAGSLYGTLASARSNLRAARSAYDEENGAYEKQSASDLWDKAEADRRSYRDQRSWKKSLSETFFNRNLQASDAWYGDNALGAALSRYQLIGARGAQDWRDSETELEEQKRMLDSVVAALEELETKSKAGTITRDEEERLQKLRSQREALQSEYDSDYQEAVKSRLATEDELLALENKIREEQLGQMRQYVDEYGNALKDQLTAQAQAEEEEQRRRLEERSKVQEEQRQALAGQKAIASGSSEAFNIASRIYDRGQLDLPPEKKIEKSTEQIERYVKLMQEQMMNYFAAQSDGMQLSMTY